MEQVVSSSSGSLEAGWAWYEKSQGVVAWAFRNADSSRHSMILLRNSYYLGDAYWSIYSSNPGFRTSFLNGSAPPRPLAGSNVPQNAAPLGLVQFDGFQQAIVCFVITLSPGQAWAMLERDFGQFATPSGVAIYDATPLASGEYCIASDPRAVGDWDDQTRTRLAAYTPNPSTFNTWLFQAENSAPYSRVFAGDAIASGRCAPIAPVMLDAPVPQPASQTSAMFPPVFPDVLSPPVNP
jgi:hypothetical protein